jgi:RNA-directed DNA polymerase
LGISGHCTHVKYHGGLKATIADVQHHLPRYRFVLRTDVFEYYAHIDHEILIDALASRIKDQFLMNLVVQYLKHTVDHGGNLQILDEALGNSGLYYVRYMDDVLILAPTRWRLRKAIRVLQGIFTRLKLRTRTDKTSIGRIEKGFDFLGYHLTRAH